MTAPSANPPARRAASNCSLVTGAAGFIGSHLCAALLARGDRVVGVDNFDGFYPRAVKEDNLRRAAGAGLRFQEADIRDRDAMRTIFADESPARVFHMAALAGVRPSIEQPHRFADVNVNGLVSVLDAARGAGCEVVLFASSSSVYGNNAKVPFAETDAVDEPISPYAATKRAGELICHAHARLFGLRIACLRFFTVYGPGQRPDLAISKFMELISRGEAVPMFGDGATSRDYTYIDDVIAGVLASERAIDDDSHKNYRIWNLGGSSPVTLRDLIDHVAAVVGKPAIVDRRPMQPGDVERTWADLARSREELGYRPATSFVEGLKRQWTWMRRARPD